MIELCRLVGCGLMGLFRSRASLEIEILARPIHESAVFLARLMRPHTFSDEARRIAFGFITA